jgi:hypothetical protein
LSYSKAKVIPFFSCCNNKSSQVVRRCYTSRCLIHLPTYDFLYLHRVSYSKVFQPRPIAVPYPVQRAFSHEV